jgi:hypothetical protein
MQGHQFIVSRPPLPEAGPLPTNFASPASEAPEADESQDEEDIEESENETSSSTSLPPALADKVVSTRNGSVSTKLLPRALRRLVKPPLLWKISNTSIC